VAAPAVNLSSQFLGLIAFGVGLIVSIPLCFISAVFMYHHLVGVRGCPLAPGWC